MTFKPTSHWSKGSGAREDGDAGSFAILSAKMVAIEGCADAQKLTGVQALLQISHLDSEFPMRTDMIIGASVLKISGKYSALALPAYALLRSHESSRDTMIFSETC